MGKIFKIIFTHYANTTYFNLKIPPKMNENNNFIAI